MRVFRALLRVIALFLLTLAATSIRVAGQTAPSDGAALFKTKCTMCHGPDAAGKVPMGQRLNVRDLRSTEVQKQSDADLAHVISHGKGKMPAFAKAFSEDQIKLLVAHIRTLDKK